MKQTKLSFSCCLAAFIFCIPSMALLLSLRMLNLFVFQPMPASIRCIPKGAGQVRMPMAQGATASKQESWQTQRTQTRTASSKKCGLKQIFQWATKAYALHCNIQKCWAVQQEIPFSVLLFCVKRSGSSSWVLSVLSTGFKYYFLLSRHGSCSRGCQVCSYGCRKPDM